MEQQAPLSQETPLAPSPEHKVPPTLRQLDLVLHDARLKGMTPTQRQATLNALAHLLIEASGVAFGETSHDHA